MKLINKTRLHFSSENSDKIYEVDLVEVSERKNQYLVNFRYGRRGHTLREGTKTPTAVAKAEAQKLFDSVVIAKLNKGYVDVEQAASSAGRKNTVPSSQAMYPEMKDSTSHVRALIDQLSHTKLSKKRARLAWRLGELGRPEAITTLYGFIHKGDWLEDYSIAWAIGRCGDHKHSEYLIPLLQHKEEKVRHIAFEAQLNLAPQHLKADLLKPALSQLPEALKNQLTGPSTEILAELERLFAYPDANHHTMLVALYRAAVIFVNLHSAMIELMKTLPFKPGYFIGIRHLFKAAEFRQDALMFAILTYRFETTSPFFRHDWDYAYVADKGNLRPSKELKKADSSLAYSNKTQSYFRKRCWRSIRRLGDANSQAYVPLAAAILMQMSDDDQGQEQSGEVYHYDDNWNRQLVAANEYGLYANFLSFNHIIYHNSPHYQLGKSGKAWLKLGQENHQQRTEAYPHLWDQQLNEVENLLTHNHCEPVHRFCCRIAQDHIDHFATLQPQSLCAWLNQPYVCTQQLAFTLAKAQLEQAFFGDLVLGLLRSKDESARQFAIAYLQSHSQWRNNYIFIAELCFVEQKDIQTWRLKTLSGLQFSLDEQCKMLESLIEQALKHLNNEDFVISPAQLAAISQLIREKLAHGCQHVTDDAIEPLLAIHQEAYQFIGALIVQLQPRAFADIPTGLFNKLSHSPYAVVRGVAITLIGRQSDEQLLQQPQRLLDIFDQGEQAERLAAAKIIGRLCPLSLDFFQATVKALTDICFKKERLEGQHQDIKQLFATDLQPLNQQVDNDMVWRLLQAQSKGAQQLGALFLATRSPKTYSVRQWAVLANHPEVQVRKWSQNAYSGNVDHVKQHKKDSLIIFDSQWLDSRTFATQYFRAHFNSADWNPQLLIHLCDSVESDVQAFGRELLQRFFNEAHGEDYLLKLSQHPSENTQLFASQFLHQYAADKPAVIASLKGYFIRVFSLVNKGRVCKDRLFDFLIAEAKKSAEIANLAGEIFTRQSVTCVMKDKSRLIVAMLALKRQYPELALPIQVQPTTIWQDQRKPIAGAATSNQGSA